MSAAGKDPKPSSPETGTTPIPEDAAALVKASTVAPLGDLFSDPEVRRRIGQVISKAAQRPPSSKA